MDNESESSQQYPDEMISETDPDGFSISQNQYQRPVGVPLDPQVNLSVHPSPPVTLGHLSSSPTSPQLTTVNSPSTPEGSQSVTVDVLNIPQNPQVTPVTSQNTHQSPRTSTAVSRSDDSSRSTQIDFANNELPSNTDVPTVPPPPYWSVDAANNILEGPTAGNRGESDSRIILAPPPSYNSLFKHRGNSRPYSASSQDNSEGTGESSDLTSEQANENLGHVSTTAVRVVYEEPSGEQLTTRSPAKTTALALLILVFGTALPLAMLVVGARKFNDCPGGPGFPAILMAFALLHMYEAVWNYRKYFRKAQIGRNTSCWFWFLCIWILTTSVYTYKTELEFKSRQSNAYCDPILYRFLLCLVVFYDILLVLAILLYLCLKFSSGVRNSCITRTLTRALTC